MTGAVHATKVDRSKETGTLVACTCGIALGPFQDHDRALAVAREHRQATKPERPQKTAAERQRHNAQQRESRRRKREAPAAAERPAERSKA